MGGSRRSHGNIGVGGFSLGFMFASSANHGALRITPSGMALTSDGGHFFTSITD